jgi:hypothetical protein
MFQLRYFPLGSLSFEPLGTIAIMRLGTIFVKGKDGLSSMYIWLLISELRASQRGQFVDKTEPVTLV